MITEKTFQTFLDSKRIPTFDQAFKLYKDRDCFIMKEETIDDVEIVSFNYRLAHYEDFASYGARNMRGIIFEKNSKNIIALPLIKFFNYNENPFTEENVVKNWTPIHFTEKADGSLIYFFMINNKLYCRTQNNSFSEQSQWAMDIVNNNSNLKENIIKIIKLDLTPCFEFTSPRNQVVIPYGNEELVFLGARNMSHGIFHNPYELTSVIDINIKEENHVRFIKKYDFTDISSVINQCDNSDGKLFEGFVVEFKTEIGSEFVKFKTKEYHSLHLLKNNSLIEKNIVEHVLNGTIDDIKSYFSTDNILITNIEKIENKVIYTYNHYLNLATSFYNNNMNLSQKDYAILLTKESIDDKFFFTLGMKYYSMSNKNEFENFLKEMILKKWEMI